MKIGVIGAGWLGGTVGEIWAKAGHEVMFSSRRPEAHVARAQRLRAWAGTMQEAADFGEVALIAIRYRALPDVAEALGPALAGKIVLDACNPYTPDPPAFQQAIEAEGVALATARLLPDVRLARAFSAVDATAVEASAENSGETLGVPIASDDPEALLVAERLVRDAGCEPVSVGGLAAARSFQRGGPGFRAHLSAPALRRRLRLD